VGLKRDGRKENSSPSSIVTIPRGGLGTNRTELISLAREASPSHPVGSEQWNNQVLEIWKKKSPSHTVGLEHYVEIGSETHGRPT